MTVAHAYPTKRFFIEMITRDISLEDSIMDLIDNSIDSFVRTRGLRFTAENLLSADSAGLNGQSHGYINVSMNADEFRIEDRTGGIPRHRAVDEVFRFGSRNDRDTPTLGVYGIGLKRAIFKIGREIQIVSRTATEGFEIVIDERWMGDDDDWELPMKLIDGAGTDEAAGTTIRITKLNPNVRTRISDGEFEGQLFRAIGRTYPYFLGRIVTVELNHTSVPPIPIPLGTSEELVPATDHLREDSVQITLIAGMADRSKGDWTTDRAGWYILCNGRVVVSADKTELTGWGVNSPQFHTKYRGFVGVAFFFSEHPDALPWTTTKRGINRESPVYLQSKRRMEIVARPVLNFLNSMYPTDAVPDTQRRVMAEQVTLADIGKIARSAPAPFRVAASMNTPTKTTVKVQFDADSEDLDRIRKCLKKQRMSAAKIGEHTLKYFIDMECPR